MPEFSDGDATRILQAIEERIRRRLKNGALMSTTWGRVASTDADGANVYLYDELTLETVASEGFRIPNGYTVAADDMVKVWMDKSNGERWLDPSSCTAIIPTSIPGGFLTIEAADGEASEGGQLILEGAGANADWNLDVLDGNFRIHSAGVEYVRVTTTLLSLHSGMDISWNNDTNLYRDSANVLRTDDQFQADTIRVLNTADVGLASTGHGFQVGSSAGTNIAMDGNEIMARNNGATSTMSLQADGGRVGINQNSAPTTSADGILLGSDVTIYREGADAWATDDDFRVGGGTFAVGAVGAGQSADGVNIGGGSIEMRSANPFIDFKMSNVDFGARIIYDFSISDALEFTGATTYEFDNEVNVAGNLTANLTEGSFDTFSIVNGGTATFGSKVCRWFQIGKIVVFRISFAVTANGSGASTVTVGAFTGMPGVATTMRVWGDRGGTGVTAIVGRWSGGTPSISTIDTLSGVRVDGAGLASGATYTFCGAYVAS